MIAVAKKKNTLKRQAPLPRKRTHTEPSPARIPWPEDEPTEPELPERGRNAVQHIGITRGRRSKLFPDLNITATAARLGITKSHLARVLAGRTKPSLDLAMKLAEVLDRDLYFVVSLAHNRNVDTTPTKKAVTKGKKKK